MGKTYRGYDWNWRRVDGLDKNKKPLIMVYISIPTSSKLFGMPICKLRDHLHSTLIPDASANWLTLKELHLQFADSKRVEAFDFPNDSWIVTYYVSVNNLYSKECKSKAEVYATNYISQLIGVDSQMNKAEKDLIADDRSTSTELCIGHRWSWRVIDVDLYFENIKIVKIYISIPKFTPLFGMSRAEVAQHINYNGMPIRCGNWLSPIMPFDDWEHVKDMNYDDDAWMHTYIVPVTVPKYASIGLSVEKRAAKIINDLCEIDDKINQARLNNLTYNHDVTLKIKPIDESTASDVLKKYNKLALNYQFRRANTFGKVNDSEVGVKLPKGPVEPRKLIIKLKDGRVIEDLNYEFEDVDLNFDSDSDKELQEIHLSTGNVYVRTFDISYVMVQNRKGKG